MASFIEVFLGDGRYKLWFVHPGFLTRHHVILCLPTVQDKGESVGLGAFRKLSHLRIHTEGYRKTQSVKLEKVHKKRTHTAQLKMDSDCGLKPPWCTTAFL